MKHKWKSRGHPFPIAKVSRKKENPFLLFLSPMKIFSAFDGNVSIEISLVQPRDERKFCHYSPYILKDGTGDLCPFFVSSITKSNR
jgi:hypothetical protein